MTKEPGGEKILAKKLIFIIGSPRSGSTMLQRILGSHSKVFTHPEPHIISPLAHLGYYENVHQAPYDHINAAEAIREFVKDLPHKEADYLAACRAYTDILYGRMLLTSRKDRFLDKTPANGLVLPFLSQLYPQAKYVVLTRHPLAVLSSYANSFFEGDYPAAVAFNNIVGRYVPAQAAFMRQMKVPYFHIRYEDLVQNPEKHMAEMFSFLGLRNEPDAVNYGQHAHVEKSYGDPKVKQHTRPNTGSIDKWAQDLTEDETKLAVAQKVIETIDANDFQQWGYDKDKLFDPVAAATGRATPKKRSWKWNFNTYRIKRKVFLSLRKNIHKNRFGRVVKRVKYYCDVLLRS
jgi:hypothetical protein